MSNLECSYIKILSVLQQLIEQSNFLNQIRIPKLSDIEVIALALTAEYLNIDSERELFRRLPASLFDQIERSVYNRRKRQLFIYIEALRQQMADQMTSGEDHFLIDSMPLEVCKISRAGRSTICNDDVDTAPNHGYCASQSMRYYGYKLHAVCSVDGVFKHFDLSPASVHDIHYLNDIKGLMKDCHIIGDKGYLSHPLQLDLFDASNINLHTPMRKNQLNYKRLPWVYSKARKRIETLFSQLCDQFMIRRNYAKTFKGFATRIMAKITALTIIQWINYLENRNINNLKIKIA
ncbi:IS982 family transposase [Marinicella gelatinilytica]|uniref:IS982 family transposase n=1 Tax=Marinicella gelatinilytica TaxID=2996017 RepID=UPI002260ECAB|nr:IS982 family transposase [Marinicella gelatinilytica]MCX7545237.1 IS982 family transposase [Marinicella gelatinilytica]